MNMQTGRKKISKAILLNLILGTTLVLVCIFGYFYLRKTSPVDVFRATVPVDIPEYEYVFAVYGGAKNFNNPYEVLVFNNLIYVSDTDNGRIAVYDKTGDHVRDIASKEIQSPSGMFWDGTRLYVADPISGKVFMLNPEGQILDTLELDGILVADVAVDNGFLYLLNNKDQTVEKYELATKKKVKSFGGYGSDPGKLYYPYDLTVRDGQIYVADSMNNRINIYDPEGELVRTLPKKNEETGEGALFVPRGLAFDKAGRLYTVEGMAHRVSIMNTEGETVTRITRSETIEDQEQEIYLPTDVTLDDAGRMYVLEHAFKRVLVYKPR